jgi:hypothetical protein
VERWLRSSSDVQSLPAKFIGLGSGMSRRKVVPAGWMVVAAVWLACACGARQVVPTRAAASGSGSRPVLAVLSASVSSSAVVLGMGTVPWPEVPSLEALTLGQAARNMVDVFGNTEPRPLQRGWATLWHVQFLTNRFDKEIWQDTLMAERHGELLKVEKRVACEHPVPVSGNTVRTAFGEVRLVRGVDHDTLWTGAVGDMKAVAMPRGASHGACLGPGGSAVWVSWSTPNSPPDLWAVTVRTRYVKPLRIDYRPGLGELHDMKSSLRPNKPWAWLEPKEKKAKGIVWLVHQRRQTVPLAAWDPVARLMVENGLVVVLAVLGKDHDWEQARAWAKSKWNVPDVIVGYNTEQTSLVQAPGKQLWMVDDMGDPRQSGPQDWPKPGENVHVLVEGQSHARRLFRQWPGVPADRIQQVVGGQARERKARLWAAGIAWLSQQVANDADAGTKKK